MYSLNKVNVEADSGHQHLPKMLDNIWNMEYQGTNKNTGARAVARGDSIVE